MEDSLYHGKDGRLRVYVRETKKTISYPKYLMEKELGRQLLPNEVVHHIDGNPLNNDITNLKVMTRNDHARGHMTKYVDTVAVCGWCGKEFLWTGLQQQRYYSERRTGRHKSASPFCSRECSGRYGQQSQTLAGTREVPWRSPNRKLTSEQVKYIREHHIPYDRDFGARSLASRFNVDKSVIDLIVKGRTYKDIP